MKIHEYQARELFQKVGIPVPQGRMVTELNDAALVAEEIGYPVVLKAQVLVGGRGKAGGIKIAQDQSSIEKSFRELKTLTIKGYAVERILVVKTVSIKQEFYVAVTVDNLKSDVVLIASPAGGIDIEETAKKTPERIHKLYLNGQKTVDEERLLEFIQRIFENKDAQAAAAIFKALIQVFFQYSCSLTEVNPLVIDGENRLVAADAKVIFDDNALVHHPELKELRDLRYEDPDEMEAKEHDLSFVKLDGTIGCIVNGAGLAMATTDVIKLLGGEPANFLDVGGSSNPQKVLNALKIILRNPKVKAILINIFGGITRCDDIAQGILEAKKGIEIKIPLVIRLTGTNEKEAKELLSKENMKIYASMREAVTEVVALAKK